MRGMKRGALAVGILVGVATLIGAALSIPPAKADGRNTDRVAITIPTSCTISVDSSASSEHSATINSGQNAVGIGNTRMGAYCNDLNGYYIYAIGYGDNTDGNNKLVSDINTNYDIATGTALSGDTSNWAMKITGGTGTTPPYVVDRYRSYTTIPSAYDVVAYRESGTASSGTTLETSGSYIDTTYQAYVTSVQPAGTYVGQVKYTLVHPFDASKLVSVDTAFRIAQKDKVRLVVSDDDATDKQVLTDSTASIPEGYSLAGSYYTMQDMSGAICRLVTMRGEKTQTQLVDVRDGSIYWVARLADNNCWMTQNLELDLDSTAIAGSGNALTSENTDLTNYSSAGGAYSPANGYSQDESGKITWVPARTTVTSLITGTESNFPDTTAANSTSYSYDPGDKYYYTSGGISNDAAYTLAQCEAKGYTDCAHYKAGNYYNWSAAVASNDTSSYASNANATNSICPRGWRLPRKTADEFKNLADAYGITSSNALELRNSPLYFVRSGIVSGGSLSELGSNGRYWTNATAGNASYAHRLSFNNSNDGLNLGSSLRYYGLPVRCMVGA